MKKFNYLVMLSIFLSYLMVMSACSDDNSLTDPITGGGSIIGTTGPAGGIIFYDKGNNDDGWQYLEAAPASSEINAQWGAYEIDVSGTQTDVTQTGVGTGKDNTKIINKKLQELGETGRASQLCASLNIGVFNDWFLPSKDELNLMYRNLHKKGFGNFGNGPNSESWMNTVYWSSSQGNNHDLTAWRQDFGNGIQYDLSKDHIRRVRAVRAY